MKYEYIVCFNQYLNEFQFCGIKTTFIKCAQKTHSSCGCVQTFWAINFPKGMSLSTHKITNTFMLSSKITSYSSNDDIFILHVNHFCMC